MTRIGICAPKSAMRSKPLPPTSGSRLSAQNSRIFGSSDGDLPRREHARQQRAVDRVRGRILEDEDPRRHLDAGLDDLEDAAAAGDVGVAVDEAALDVVVATERVEVVLLVVVEGCLVAEPCERRVRVAVDLDVVRVVREIAGLRSRC